ncbi:MAG TPA: protein-methionine-sulfoxide reductase heme-binding subunit MsrQ [Polyangiaceae bacterium]|nr:protein-methionine-sulfoxide reductase heme-binding subunit MsrQ [Polyangiaceae bacterium]
MTATADVRVRSKPLSWLVPAVVTGSFAPFVSILYRAATHGLGANPIATVLNQLGLLALIFLVASLACTPIHLLFKANWALRLRRSLGLFAFFTALAHFSTYAILDQGFALGTILADITKRPFIAVGFIAFVLLIPLALTSTKKSVARLGFARWKRLHRLVYASALLAALHFYMRVKADTRLPLTWAAILGALLLVRIVDAVRSPRRRATKRR